jgi:hypothetical protein
LQKQAERLQGENERLSTANTQLNCLLSPLRQQVVSLQVCSRIPLWAAVIRADMKSGVLSDSSLALLERMRSVEPDVANPLLAEIRARNHLVPDEPFDLSGLSGEARLFAGLANSLLVEKTDTLQSVEVLLDVWEEYLQQVNTPAH